MRILNNFISIIIAGILLSGCGKPKNLEYKGLKNVHVMKIGVNETDLSMDLVFFNPNHIGLTVKNVDCDIFLNKTFVGHFKMDQILKIPANQEFSVPSKVSINIKSILANALSVIATQDFVVGVEGNIRAGKGVIYFNIPIHYEGHQKLKFNLSLDAADNNESSKTKKLSYNALMTEVVKAAFN